MVLEVNRDNYDEEVLHSRGVVLVDFWGPQCKPCIALMPAVERLEKLYEGRLKILKLNAQENRMLCARLRVLGLPTFLIYNDGVEIKRLTGDHITEADLLKAVDSIFTEKGGS